MPDLSYIALSVLHFVLASILLALCVACIRRRRSILGLTTAAFLVIDSMGLAIAPYYPIETLPYAARSYYEIRNHNESLYLTQIMAHWLFFMVAGAALIIELTRPVRGAAARMVRTDKTPLIRGAILLTVIGSLAYIRYFAFGPGFELLTSTRFFFDNVDAAVAHRMLATVDSGEGAFMASLAANAVFPLAAMAFARATGKAWPIAVFGTLSLAFGFQTRQKAPLIAPALEYTLLFISARGTKKSLRGLKMRFTRTRLVIVGVATFCALAYLYTANFGLSVRQAVSSNFIRTVLVPSAGETNFFASFPDTFNYRGLFKGLFIRMDDAGPDDISVFQVAQASTGITFSSNASFLAVGWSGMGYVGVLFVSLLVVGILYAIDRMYASRLPPIDSRAFIAVAGLCLVPAALGLTSGSVGNFLTNGGFINPLIAYWLLRRDSVFVRWNIQHAMPRSVLTAQRSQG